MGTLRNRADHLTSRDYKNPRRPRVISGINTLGAGPLKPFINRPIEVNEIIDSARKIVDFEGERTEYLEPLTVLVDSIEKEAGLNSVGRMITRGRLTRALAGRFRTEKIIASNPDILKQPLASPLIITGLQRTGTTLLHRLIASDSQFRSIASWEGLDPTPPINQRDRKKRIRQARLAEKGAAWIAPDFFAVHPIDHLAPEEDVLLLDSTFHSTTAEAILRVPSYSSWLETADSTPAYEFLRLMLLTFQYNNPKPYWVLKTPHHLEYLDILLEVFPEAKIIQTHRDPGKTMGSFLSMLGHAYGMFTDTPDPEEIGDHWYRKCQRMVQKGMEVRDTLDEDTHAKHFLDLQFTDIMTNPMIPLKQIYEFAGIEYNEKTELNASDFLSSHGRHRFGRHVYKLNDFGLDSGAVRSGFAEYRKKYGVPDEK